MKKKILIVIHSLGCGGAEKSLISLLSLIPADRWDIDLLIADKNGMHVKNIPSYVNQINDQFEFENYAAPLKNRRKKICSMNDFVCQCRWQIFRHFSKKKSILSYGELRWDIWGRRLKKLDKSYDLAISYMNGYPNYYVIDKVDADKKILWVHNEFEKLGYNYDFEYPYYAVADRIVTISQSCVDSILKVYPEFIEKTLVLENITSSYTVNKLAEAQIEDEFISYEGLKLLSIGRLNSQKRFDLAIEAAKILKEENTKFLWYILGEGELRPKLTSLIEKYGLKDFVKLIGIKGNPYPYIKACNIFIQTSEYEGKSIVLDEAKVLCKPIVVTNYKTVVNSIQDNVNGRIVEMSANSIAEGIFELTNDVLLRNRFCEELKNESAGNEGELKKYILLFDELLS